MDNPSQASISAYVPVGLDEDWKRVKQRNDKGPAAWRFWCCPQIVAENEGYEDV